MKQNDLVRDITAKHNEVSVSETRLKVSGGRWTYVACLAAVENSEDVT